MANENIIPTIVHILEYERGWGSKVEDKKSFDSYADAEKFVEEYNSRNTATVVPDWYMKAEIAYKGNQP